MYFDLTNIAYEGIRVDRGESSPIALIRIPKIIKIIKGTQNGYQITCNDNLISIQEKIEDIKYRYRENRYFLLENQYFSDWRKFTKSHHAIF